MSSSNITPPSSAPPSQKAQRKAAAAAANDRTIYQRTEFGRWRIRSLQVRLAQRLIVLLGVPFLYAYRSIRSAKGRNGG